MLPADLRAFLLDQSPTDLVDVLLELAAEHPDVPSRLEQLQLVSRPDKLAASFRKSLSCRAGFCCADKGFQSGRQRGYKALTS